MVTINLKEIPKRNITAKQLYSKMFGLTEEEIEVVLNRQCVPIQNCIDRTGLLEARTIIRVVMALCAEGAFSANRPPKDIKFVLDEPVRTSFEDDTEPITETFLRFKVGHKTSCLSETNVLRGEYYGMICASTEGLASLENCNLEILLRDSEEFILDSQVSLWFLSNDYKNIVLDCAEWKSSIKLSTDAVLTVKQDCTVTAACPLSAKHGVTIKGDEGTVLKLINTDKVQPCIGGETVIGLSSKRWSKAIRTCYNIEVDGVTVLCESPNENFMLGEMGTNNVPKVVCTNGGSLEAAEMHGNRVMEKEQIHWVGSTKFSDYPVYRIVKGNGTRCKEAKSF